MKVEGNKGKGGLRDDSLQILVDGGSEGRRSQSFLVLTGKEGHR